tara:strand:+ start:56 stop:616 length:561 start_codon:yes stop_codon:yes gene_type:complete
MKNLNKAIILFADEVLKSAKRRIGGRRIGRNKNYGVATGTLKRSLSYRVRVRSNEVREVTFGARGKADKYASFIHWGVNGTQKNQKSPFFRFRKQPPSKVFLPWIRSKGIRLRDEKGRFKKQTQSNMNSLAFLIARSVKRKGIVGLRFYEKAFVAVSGRINKKIGEALAEDIKDKFKLNLGNITVK